MIESFASYTEFVDSEFPVRYQSEIPEALNRAYLTVSDLMKDVSFLKTPGGDNSRGHLIQSAVDFQLLRLIETGVWRNFDFHWESFAKPTGKFLQILPKNTVVTISRLQHDRQFPRNAQFRNNQRLNNDPQQISLFADEIREEDQAAIGRPHLIIGHGYHEPTFAHIYIPHSHRKFWNWSSKNLYDLPHAASSDMPPAERPKLRGEPEIKEEFKEWLIKNERNGNNY